MKKNLLLFLAIFILSMPVFSQRDTVKYNVVRNDPYDIPNLYISLSPFDFALGAAGYIGFSARVDASITKKININASYSTQYPKLSIGEFESIIGEFLTNSNVNFKFDHFYNYMIDFGFGYTISDKTRTEDITVTLSSSTANSYNVTVITNNVIQAKAEHRKFIRLRLGGIYKQFDFKAGNNVYTTDGTLFNYYNYDISPNADDVVKYSDVNYENLLEKTGSTRLNNKMYSDIYGKFSTKVNVPALYFGVSINKVMNQILDVNDYGLRGNGKYTSLYFDFVLGKPSMSTFEFYKSNPNALVYGEEISSEVIEYEVDFDRSKIITIPAGFRIGYASHRPFFSKFSSFENKLKKIERPIYFTFYAEAGLMPALGIKNAISLKVGLGIDINPL